MERGWGELHTGFFGAGGGGLHTGFVGEGGGGEGGGGGGGVPVILLYVAGHCAFEKGEGVDMTLFIDDPRQGSVAGTVV